MLVSWLRGIFDKETNVWGRDTTHHKRLALFQESAFTTTSHGTNREMGGCRGQYSSYKLLSMTDGAIITLLQLCCRYGGQPLLLWVWELQHNEGYRSVFTIVIVASKNRRTTVSPSTGTHYMKMHGWVWRSNTGTRRSLWANPNVTQWKTSATTVMGLFSAV